MKNYLFISVLLLLCVSPVFGLETLILDDGEILKVKLLNEDTQHYTFKRPEDGSIGVISKDRILRIVYKDINRAEANKIRSEEERKRNINFKKKKSAHKKKWIIYEIYENQKGDEDEQDYSDPSEESPKELS